MKSVSVAFFGLLLLAVIAQEVSAKKRKCSEKPADMDDAVIEKAIEECAEEKLQNGGDPEKVLEECAASLLKDYQEHHANSDCGGQTKGFRGFMQKAKALAKALKDAFQKSSESITDAISQLHKGIEGLIESGKKLYEGFTKSLRNSNGETDESDSEQSEQDEFTNE